MPIPSDASFLGGAKEATRGTAVPATTFFPYRTINSPNDNPHKVDDTNGRGAPVDSYGQTVTQSWAEPDFGGDIFVDVEGLLLLALFGEEAISGTGPYAHKYTLLNSGNMQPPSLTLSDYNGNTTRQIPGCLVQSYALRWTAAGLLERTVKLQGFKSATTTKPTPIFGSEPPKPGYSTVTTLGGVAINTPTDGELTFTRAVDSLPSTGGTVDPYAIFGGKFSVAGRITLTYESTNEAEYVDFVSGATKALDLNFTNAGVGAALRTFTIHASKIAYSGPTSPDRGASAVKLPLPFKCVANTTDVGASGGWGPCTVTVQNALATAY